MSSSFLFRVPYGGGRDLIVLYFITFRLHWGYCAPGVLECYSLTCAWRMRLFTEQVTQARGVFGSEYGDSVSRFLFKLTVGVLRG